MGTTAGGLRYPEGSDPANVPLVVQNLAEDVDTFKASKANPTFTGVASFPDGSASAPSITNTGDTNTGLAFPADDTVAISTGGTERVRVDSNGLVGIATTSPSAQLHITGTFLQQRDSSTNTHILSAGATFNRLAMRRASGTNASPTIVSNGDAIGDILWLGYDGAAYQQMALIGAYVDEAPGAGDMPGRLGFFTSPDGSTSPTERMRIDRNGTITGTGSLGAWTAYTPTLGGTGWAIGNGTVAGNYCQIGKIVHFTAVVVFGSTSTFGAGDLTISLPLTAGNFARHHMFGRFLDSSAGLLYGATARPTSSTVLTVYSFVSGSAGQLATVKDTVPFTWASSDEIRISGTYEAA